MIRAGQTGVGLSALGLLGAACSSSPSGRTSSKTVTIWDAPQSTQDVKYFNSHLKAFEKSNPGISVTYNSTPWATWTPTYTAAYRGNTPPDIAYMPSDFFTQFAGQGALTDLSTVAGPAIAKWKPLFAESIWSTMIHKGVLYGLPWIKGGTVLVWNKAHFRAAGLNPDQPPQTWTQLMAYAKTLTKTSGGKTSQWGYGIMDNTQNLMLNFVPVAMVDYGGPLTTPNYSKWIADGPGYVEGLQTHVDMLQKDKTAPPIGTFVGSDINTAFLQGKISMMLTVVSLLWPSLPQYPGFEMGVAQVPSGPKGNATVGACGGWFIAEKSQNKTAAWKVIEYIASKSFTIPFGKAAEVTPAAADWNPFPPASLMGENWKAQGTYTPLPQLPFDYWTITMPLVEQALVGQLSAKQALTTGANEVNARIAALS